MDDLINKLKTIISLIEKGHVHSDRLSQINMFVDSLLVVNENYQSHLQIGQTPSYRDRLLNLHRALLIKCIVVNEVLLSEFRGGNSNQPYKDPGKIIQILEMNWWVLNNLNNAFRNDDLQSKILFSHWEMEPDECLINFRHFNGTWDYDAIWDYASVFNYQNIFEITALGLDVPDDFDGNILTLNESQRSLVNEIKMLPLNKDFLLFFVNRNCIFYQFDLKLDNIILSETRDIQIFRSLIKEASLNQMINNVIPSKVDRQLYNLSILFNENVKRFEFSNVMLLN